MWVCHHDKIKHTAP